MIRYILAMTLAFGCLAASADESLPKELPPDQESAALQAAETTGLTIYRHDQAAAVATDAALKLRQFKKDKRVKGWITEEHQDQIVVTFIDQTPAALYRTVVSKDGAAGPVAAMETPAPLTLYEAGAATARAAALASKFQPCSENYNPVVLPTTDSGSWVVYLIPGTTKNNVVPIGGTYRVAVSGSNVVSQRGFTRTCIALQTDPRAAGLMITHLLDPIPTEAHVFWSIWAKKPLYVATPPNGTIWVVEGNKIRLVERKAAEG
ncbi:hypothetical protein [Dokdonella sp.]|uniref:hypothetical protein n=1 Tax=Dokdonella sp. TaxID=2291710 RepID=UPI0025C4B90C|nr:hypothetical protein [Dokdonella sp.]MBX3691571.1 hypothetical protein [Dokdonella sp.]